ncbi:MAG: GIY-YIG nuclease family protein [Chlorobi bacterium]|nr:GIY-YIG nuclease family protein [Chlorobiota bacterium]
MLKLVELIRMSGIDLGHYKIHCAIDNKRGDWRPLQAYFAGTFEIGQSEQTHKNFECENILSLIHLSNSRRWLYVGVYRVDGVREAKTWSGFIYTLTRVPGLEHLDGRVVVDFPKLFRASYLVGPKHENNLIVNSIREERLSIVDFPGFNGVRLSFEVLRSIIRDDNPSWRSALASVAGVYVITDTATGYQYVGSAYGGVGLWQRWTEYAKNGHGGNKKLRELLWKNGKEYANNFQFSLVEVCDINASKEYIISRENHWKDVLMTREFGLNVN